MRAASVTGLLTMMLAGCATPLEDVRKEPVRLTLSVPAPWDRVGACIAAAYNNYETLYLPNASDKRAEVIVNQVATGLLGSIKRTMFLFEISASHAGSNVTWRRDQGLAASFEQEAKDRIERCGKA